MSQFLDFREKHDVFNHWVRAKPSLNASELKVLFRLLDHQNPTTGRCDPSIPGLSEKTGIGTRMVRKAINGLEARGAIKVLSRSRGRRNTYRIGGVSKEPWSKARKSGSDTGEPAFPKARNSRSPEKENQKEKKKNSSKRMITGTDASRGESEKVNNRQRRLREELLEKKARDAFTSAGMSYEDLISVPAEKWRQIFGAFDVGEISIDTAIMSLCDIARSSKT